MAALLLLFALPAVQCSPVMLNRRPATEHSVKSAPAEHPHVPQRYSRYRHWEAQNAALTAIDAEKAQMDEQRIFEQGRELRRREAEFRKKLDTCKQGEQLCHRKVISEEIRQQRLRAMPHHKGSGLEVTDAMGRSMPMLFNGHPEPFHKSNAASASLMSVLFAIAITGLVN